MKNKKQNRPLANKMMVTTAMLGMLAVAFPQAASANTGAGASILNVVTVNYQDASATTSFAETGSSMVTVSLVPSAPTLNTPVDQAIASGATATYIYTVSATANGSDVYDIAGAVNTSANVAGVSVTPSLATVTLGASVIDSVPVANQITVPFGSDSNLLVGDLVVINGNIYLITSISAGAVPSHTNISNSDGVAGATTSEIKVTINLTPIGAWSITTADIGQQVGELYAFTVDVTATTTSVVDGTVAGDTTATSQTLPAATSTDQTTTTFQAANLDVVKEVSTDGGITFAATTNAGPGDTLTYRITITNGGTGVASIVVITDTTAPYTSYTVGTAKAGVSGDTYASAGTILTDANPADDGYDYGLTTAGNATYSLGNVAGSGTVTLFYQVTVD